MNASNQDSFSQEGGLWDHTAELRLQPGSESQGASFMVAHPHPIRCTQNHCLLLERVTVSRQAPKSYKLKLQQVCYVTCIINWDYISGFILFQQFQGEYCFEKVLCYPSQRGANPMLVGGYSRHHSGIQQELDRIFRLQDKSQLLKLKPIVLFCCLGALILTCTNSEISIPFWKNARLLLLDISHTYHT